MKDFKTKKIARLIRDLHQAKIESLLVVGCGAGIEAAILARELGALVTGIDLKEEFDSEAIKYATLQRGDAMNLEFDDASFDFVYSYHAIEHIENPLKALHEMHRVLKTKGGFWIGTPNRSRMVGYIGAENTSLKEKIIWNLADWKARFGGSFRNEMGAHAGFTSTELRFLLSSVFTEVEEGTDLYFLSIYVNKRALINLIVKSGLSRFIFPSVYFGGTK